MYLASFEDSIHLAIDTGIQDIIVTGDFNFDMLSPNLSVKIRNFCLQFSLTQTIKEPTHYTENSSSLLDLILTSNNTHLIFSGVGDPFLNQELRFHCPVYCILNFSKPKSKSYQRQTWSYDQGNYNVLRQKASATDWDTLRDSDVNIHAQNITNHIMSLANECIPNRMTRIRQREPQWLTTNIKLYIRKRKRAYRKVKRSNLPNDWKNFKMLRNKVIT